MKIGFCALGKLGLPVALAVESRGHEVYGFDVNPAVKKYLETRKIPYREKDLQPLLDKNHITWCDSVAEVVEKTDVIFLSVQTPHAPEFEGVTPLTENRADFDYSFLKNGVAAIAKACAESQVRKVVAVISTCLPGTFEREIKPLLNEYVAYVYTPQFIAMGTVLDDYLNPEFNLLGVEDTDASDLLMEFYETINDAPLIQMDITTAEGAKVSYNTWITAKTVIANAWGELCERMGMDFDGIKITWDHATTRLISTRYMDAGMSDGGGCFPAGELVMTKQGMRPIETIQPGDEVLTSEGSFQKVVKRWERQYDGELVTVQVRGLPPVRMTTDHPVFVRTDGRKRVPDGRRNTYNRIIDKLLPITEVFAGDLSLDSMIAWPHVKKCEYKSFSQSYLALAGWYLAEGSAELNSRRGRLRFDLHVREESDAQYIKQLLLECAEPRKNGRGANAKISHTTDGNKRAVRFGNKGLAERLVADFGKGATDKYIPEPILWGDLDQARALLRGLIRGDGHRSDNGISYSTISEQLAWGVFILLHRLGLNPTLREVPPRGIHKRAFEVRVRNRRLANELCEIVDWEPYVYDKEIQTYADDGKNVWRHVQKTSSEPYSGLVYNLWVDKVHSYIVGCGAVSNCHPRDNIALSWLAKEVGMSHNFWDDLMHAREDYEAWHAEVALEAAEEHDLPLVVLGKAFKPETDIETGSAAMLMAEFLRRKGMQFTHVNDLILTVPAVFFIATNNERYHSYEFPPGSVVIDPFGYIPDREGVTVKRLGRR